MKSIKKLVLITLCFFSVQTSFANKEKIHLGGTIGTGIYMFDQGQGLHVAFVPTYQLNNYFRVEGQLSFMSMHITSAWGSGEQSYETNFGAFVGLRAYAMPPNFIVRPYLNLLLGVTHNDVGYFDVIKTLPGFTGGLNFEIYKNFTTGVNFESVQMFLFKVGYQHKL